MTTASASTCCSSVKAARPCPSGPTGDHLHGAEAPEDAPITFHGQMPLWVCCQHNFYPVQTGLYPSLVHNLIYERPVVPQEEISEFLDRVWTRLPSSELYEPQQFLRMMEPVFQPATYNPKLFLDEEGSLLTLEIDNIYQTRHGEFTLNGPNPDFQTGSYTYEGQTYLVRRHQEEEAQLMNELAGMDFQARSSKLWFLEPEEAIAFLLDSYPTLVENYRVYGERALSRYKMRTAKSSISAEVVSNEKEKWFSLEISVDYEGQSLPLDKIWKAWTRGKRYVQLKDGSYTSLPESWLEKIAHKLTALGLDPSKPPQTKFKQFEAPVLDSLLEDLPGARTDSFWNNLREKIRRRKPGRPPRCPDAGCGPYRRQRRCRPICAATSCRACPTSTSCRNTASAASWPTRWAWARPCRPWLSSSIWWKAASRAPTSSWCPPRCCPTGSAKRKSSCPACAA